jgi:hypothetical protein
MDDRTDKMTALDWSLPMIDEDDDAIVLDLEPTDGSDGRVWEWNGAAWVPVEV